MYNSVFIVFFSIFFNFECSEPTEKDFCFWRGKTYHDGDKFTLNPCTDCICNGGTSHCVIRSCPPLDCKDYVVVETECCPVCQKKGSLYTFS